jgi:hypothetical protein
MRHNSLLPKMKKKHDVEKEENECTKWYRRISWKYSSADGDRCYLYCRIGCCASLVQGFCRFHSTVSSILLLYLFIFEDLLNIPGQSLRNSFKRRPNWSCRRGRTSKKCDVARQPNTWTSSTQSRNNLRSK